MNVYIDNDVLCDAEKIGEISIHTNSLVLIVPFFETRK